MVINYDGINYISSLDKVTIKLFIDRYTISSCATHNWKIFVPIYIIFSIIFVHLNWIQLLINLILMYYFRLLPWWMLRSVYAPTSSLARFKFEYSRLQFDDLSRAKPLRRLSKQATQVFLFASWMARKRHGKSSQYSRCSYSHNLPKKGRHISTSILGNFVC